MEFELLSRWQPGATFEELSSQTATETPLDTLPADAEALLDFLRQHQLVAQDAGGREALRQRVASARPPWWKQAVPAGDQPEPLHALRRLLFAVGCA